MSGKPYWIFVNLGQGIAWYLAIVTEGKISFPEIGYEQDSTIEEFISDNPECKGIEIPGPEMLQAMRSIYAPIDNLGLRALNVASCRTMKSPTSMDMVMVEMCIRALSKTKE